MDKTLKYLTILSIILNVYYMSAWIYVYNSYNLQELRVKNFIAFFPSMSLSALNIFLIILTITSIVFLLKHKAFNKILIGLCIVIQFVFLFFYIWQSL